MMPCDALDLGLAVIIGSLLSPRYYAASAGTGLMNRHRVELLSLFYNAE